MFSLASSLTPNLAAALFGVSKHLDVAASCHGRLMPLSPDVTCEACCELSGRGCTVWRLCLAGLAADLCSPESLSRPRAEPWSPEDKSARSQGWGRPLPWAERGRFPSLWSRVYANAGPLPLLRPALPPPPRPCVFRLLTR